MTYEPSQLEQWVAFKSVTGSRAYGLNKPESDYEYRGCFVSPTTKLFSLKPLREELVKQHPEDETYWELTKFVKLLLANNPNVLETLWSHDQQFTGVAGELFKTVLLPNRNKFLSNKIKTTYGGYATSQLERGYRYLANPEQEQAGWKHLMHLLRLLLSVNYALKFGDLLVDVSLWRDDLLKVRNGETTLRDFYVWHGELEKEFEASKSKSVLPDEPDVEFATDFVYKCRMAMLD